MIKEKSYMWLQKFIKSLPRNFLFFCRGCDGVQRAACTLCASVSTSEVAVSVHKPAWHHANTGTNTNTIQKYEGGSWLKKNHTILIVQTCLFAFMQDEIWISKKLLEWFLILYFWGIVPIIEKTNLKRYLSFE